jgi:hypothetical protein
MWPVFVTALGGVVGACLTFIVGRDDSRTGRLKLRLQLHGRRMKVFRETMEFLTDVYANRKIDEPRWVRFRETTNESYFLLGKDIHQFLLQINEKAAKLEFTSDQKEKDALRKWVRDQCDMVFEIFAKHMSLVEWDNAGGILR